MGLRAFDRVLGRDLLASVPEAPGVYVFRDAAGEVIYVGKARCLRRRLGQYRRAGRKRRDRRMRAVVRRAASVSWETLGSDLDASLRELALIQAWRPGRNVAGTFWQRYPLVGLRRDSADAGRLTFVLTTSPGAWPACRLFGAFRSHAVVTEGFRALMRLLRHVGHPAHPRAVERGRARVVEYRRLPGAWAALWEPFFRGDSRALLEELAVALLDRAGACRRPARVQADLDAVKRFWEDEARPLAEAVGATGYPAYPVPQADRDAVFLRRRAARAAAPAAHATATTARAAAPAAPATAATAPWPAPRRRSPRSPRPGDTSAPAPPALPTRAR